MIFNAAFIVFNHFTLIALSEFNDPCQPIIIIPCKMFKSHYYSFSSFLLQALTEFAVANHFPESNIL